MPNDLKQYLKKDAGTKVLEKEGSFNFHCAKECWGTCCIKENIGLLQLSVYDVYRLLKKRQDLNILDLIERKIEDDTHLPKAYMKWRENGWCPNLEENGSCSVYEERPFACIIFPLSAEFKIDDTSNTVTVNYLLREKLCYGFHKEANPVSQKFKDFLNSNNFDNHEKFEKLEIQKREEWQKQYDLKSLTDEQLHKLGQTLYCLQDKANNKNSYFMDMYSESLKIPKRAKRIEKFTAEELTTLALEEFAPRLLKQFFTS